MSGSDRDLVAALRAELAAVDPSRPCDRRAEIAGLGPRVRTREPAVARLVVRLGGHALEGGGVAALVRRCPTSRSTWATRRGALPLRLAARPVPRPWIAEPRERARPPRVRRARSAEAPRARRPARRRRAAGVVARPPRPRRGHLEERRVDRRVPRPDRGERVAARARGAPASRGACAATSTACSTPSRPTCSAPSRRRAASSRRSTRSRPTGGSASSRGPCGRSPRRRRETPEASLSEIATRLDLHRSAVQRALDRLERLALHDDEGVGRRRPAARRRGRAAPAGHGRRGRLWHDQAMRPVVIAANWKMNTTPADAGELARTIASRTREPGVTRVICPPFVCLAGGARRARRRRTSASGPRTSTTSSPARSPARCRCRCSTGLATWVILGHSERRAQFARDRRADRPQARPGGRRRACGRSCASARCSRSARPGARSRSSTAQLRGVARRVATRRALVRRRASSSPTSPCGRSGPGATPAARTPPRWPTRSAPASRGLGLGRARRRASRSCTAAASRPRTSGSSSPSPAIDGALVGGASLKPDEMAGIVARAGITAAARGLAG